jgi:hypothetical protein
MHDHGLSGQEALVELETLPVDAHHVVVAHPARLLDGHRLRQLLRARSLRLPSLGEAGRRRASEEPRMGAVLVVLCQEAIEPLLQLGQTRHPAEVIGAARAHRAPEALHFPARLRIVGAGVQELDPQPGTHQLEGLAAVGGAVVQVQGLWRPVDSKSRVEHLHHVQLSLLQHGLQADTVATGVVEQAVDTHRDRLRSEFDLREMTHVAVPQRHRPLGFPAHACLACAGLLTLALTVLLVEPTQRRLADLLLVEQPLGLDGREDQAGRRVRVLVTDSEQESALLVGERLGEAAIGARSGTQRLEAAAPSPVVPALEGGQGVAARRGTAGRADALLGEGSELGA